MNIQQALNQSLLAAGTSVYLAGHTIEQGKQSARAEYQAASDERNESVKQRNATSEARENDLMDWVTEDVKNGTLTKKQGAKVFSEMVLDDPDINAANERVNIAQGRFKLADRNLNKWFLRKDEPNSYRK